ncbi:MAG: hypothetical protein DMD35_04805 [Gemmatimonadetes bacterium]|nr:MAG: hypothetical protein DMD35_04805 [Gemmatimonadota bacterium]
MLLRSHSRTWRPLRSRVAGTIPLGRALLVAAGLAFPPVLSAQALAVAADTGTETFRCLDTTASVYPARLDDEHLIYVEQQTVVPQRDGRILVAGNPVWVWHDRGTGYDMLARDSLFGMVIDSTPVVRAIPSPLPGRVLNGMRAAALPDGWWMVTFADVIPAEMPKRPTVLAMWVGETDGEHWRAVRKLPVVTDSLDVTQATALEWREGRARLAVPFTKDHRARIVVHALDEGRWTASISDLGPVAAVALHLTPTHDLLAVVMPFQDSIPDMNSLFFFTKLPRDTVWSGKRAIVRAGDEPVLDPLFTPSSANVLSWRRSRNGQREWDAWFTTYDEQRDSIARPTRLATDAVEIATAAHGDDVLWATSNRAWPNPIVQVLESVNARRGARLVRQTRYRGLFGLAITHGRSVLVAAQSAATPREASVVSMIETHTWRCLSQSGPHPAQ